MTDPITVLLVDDHALVRRGFRRLLEDDSGHHRSLAKASNGDEAIRLMTELKPQGRSSWTAAMPGTGGLEATRKILAKFPKAAILMLSMHSEQTLVRQALDCRRTRLRAEERARARSRRGRETRRRRRGR